MLRPVSQLLGLPSLNREVRQLAENYISSMIQSGATKEAADYLELLVPEVFDNLREELRRFRHLKESYRDKLLELTRNVIQFLTPIDGHPLHEGAPVMSFLLDSSNEWQRIPEQGEEVVGMLLRQLADRCGAVGDEAPSCHSPVVQPRSGEAPTNSPTEATLANPKAGNLGTVELLLEPLLRLVHREQKNLSPIYRASRIGDADCPSDR